MANITMCGNQCCKRREECYRKKAPTSVYQGYKDFDPDNTGECQHFVEFVENPTCDEEACTF